MSLDAYLSLFPGASRELPRLMALASAVFSQVTDLQTVVERLNEAFSPAFASGAQLDALGRSLGLSRADTVSGPEAPDEVFRDYLLKKLLLWGWDGTGRGAAEIAERICPGSRIADHQNASVTVSGAGSQPAHVKNLYPIPAGVRVMEET